MSISLNPTPEIKRDSLSTIGFSGTSCRCSWREIAGVGAVFLFACGATLDYLEPRSVRALGIRDRDIRSRWNLVRTELD